MVGVMKLLKAVRRKCPNALIMYFGFFPGLSYKSDTGEISDWFKEEYNDDFGWWFNKHIYQVVDVNHLILEALVRSLWLWGRWEYLTKIAVDRINHSDTFRGPGVVYVPSEFTEENSVFAPKPFLWDDPFDPTKDPARQKRVTGNPRDQLLDDIWRVWLKLVAFGVSNEDRENAAVLARRLTGPTDLENDLRRVAAGQMGDAVEDVLAGLAKEAGRIQHTRIASLGHPNVNGARSYATSAAARYKSFVADRAAARTAALPPAATLRLSAIEATLARCALRSPRSPLEADIGRLDVDAFELEVETAETSEVRLVGTLWLVVSTKEAGSARQRMLRITPKYRPFGFPTPMIPVKVTPDLEPGQRSRYMVPAGRRLRLDEIRGTHLLWANDPTKFSQAGRIWTPRRVTLSVVGVDVKDVELRTVKMRPGDTLDLNWPGPEPGFKAPKITDARLRRAKKFTVQPRFLKTSDLSL
jgi:hypothetical protein